MQSAVRWRYGRFDVAALVIPPATTIPDDGFTLLGKLARGEPERVRIIDLTGGVRDVTSVFLAATDIPPARQLLERGESGLR